MPSESPAGTLPAILPWQPEYAQGAIDVVHAVYDEYGFTWDEADYHADLYDVPGHYLDQGSLFFVAVVDGQVVATVALSIFDRLPGSSGTVLIEDEVRVAGCDCGLDRLYVHPKARKGRLGTSLTDRTIDEARKLGRTKMEIWSDKRFEAAHRLYQRLGAVIVGDRICGDPDQSPEWGLFLSL
jgi:GNAT superfamily N-acetyltransferase